MQRKDAHVLCSAPTPHLASDDGRTHAKRILSVSTSLNDHEYLRHLLSEQDWHVYEANGYKEAIGRLCRDSFDILICECYLPDGSWRDLLSHLAGTLSPPSLIVTSEKLEDHLRLEVQNLGGCGVLSKPFTREAASRVLRRLSRRSGLLNQDCAYQRRRCPQELNESMLHCRPALERGNRLLDGYSSL